MLEKDNCVLCGQDIYQPLLGEYNATRSKKQEKAAKIVKDSVIEAYDDTQEAKIFAMGLVKKLIDREIL